MILLDDIKVYAVLVDRDICVPRDKKYICAIPHIGPLVDLPFFTPKEGDELLIIDATTADGASGFCAGDFCIITMRLILENEKIDLQGPGGENFTSHEMVTRLVAKSIIKTVPPKKLI